MATVAEIQANALANANDATANAEAFVSSLQQIAQTTPEYPEWPDSTSWLVSDEWAQAAIGQLYSRRPGRPLGVIVGTAEDAPDPPSISTLTTIALPNLPDLNVAAPVLNLPTPPSSSIPAAPDNPPEFVDPATPDRPTYTLPDVPSFTSVPLPDAPTIQLPSFSTELPVDDLLVPSNEFEYSESEYSSLILDELKSKILNDLINGGYGIDTDDEEALWNRFRDRETVSAQAGLAELSRQIAARGFDAPPGFLQTAQSNVIRDSQTKISDASREIALKRADLYVQNRQFTINAAREVEALLINYYAGLAERRLNANKAFAELGISYYNLRVGRYNARLEGVRIAAQVYETEIRGALAGLEEFKARIEAARGQVEVQRLAAEVYRIQVEGVTALMNLYRTDMEAAKIFADIERAKLDAYKTNVEAYLAQVQARDAEFRMYESQIRGETAKVTTYSAQVDAYGKVVDAYRSRAQAEQVRVSAHNEGERLKVDKFRGELARFDSLVRSAASQVEQIIGLYNVDANLYRAETDVIVKSVNVGQAAQADNLRILQERVKIDIAKVKYNTEQLLSTLNLNLGAASVGAKVLGDIGAAANTQLAAIATLAE